MLACARELEEVVAVNSHDGVVLLDDKPGLGAAGGDVLDEAARAETMIRRRRARSRATISRRLGLASPPHGAVNGGAGD